MERSGQKTRWAGAERWADIPENAWAGAEHGAGCHGAETNVGLSAEQQIGRSRSAPLTCCAGKPAADAGEWQWRSNEDSVVKNPYVMIWLSFNQRSKVVS